MSPLCILLVEDNRIETIKFQRVIKELFEKPCYEKESYQLIIAKNGEEALSELEKNKEIISVIFLDLNMPRMNGIEFLNSFKENLVFREIPVMTLTSSNNINDIRETYKVGAAGYIMKPLKYEDFKIQLKKIIDYWLINELSNV